MSDFFSIPIFQRALLATLMIGFANGYTSAFVLLNRSPLKLTALSHSLLPGVAVATWLVGIGVVSAFTGSVITAMLIGVLTLFIAGRTKISSDTALAVLYTGAFAAGVMILSRIGQAQELEHWLLGDIIGLSDLDLWMSFAVGIISVGMLTLFRRSMLLALFEPNVAKSLGVNVRVFHYASFALLILVLVTTLQAVGCILSIGLIVTPAATVRNFCQTARRLFLWSGLLGALGSALGLVLSQQLDLLPGPAIVLVHSSAFIISALWRGMRQPARSL